MKAVEVTASSLCEQYLYSVGVFGCVNVLFDVSVSLNAKKCFWAGCVWIVMCVVLRFAGVFALKRLKLQ